MKALRVLIAVILIGCVSGCAGMSSREQRVLSGGAFGTAAGVGAAAIFGAPLIVGAAAGAAAGAVGGLIVEEVQNR
ncbi:MAG: hypothetical protein WAW37_17100 [Syntrophobacteraceae bacterium]